MLHELHNRESDGISVTLFWDTSDDDSMVIGLTDARTKLQAMFPVPACKALDAFYHPFVYVPERELQSRYSVAA